MFPRPAEHEVQMAELVRTLRFTGTAPGLPERIRALRATRYSNISIQIRHGHPEMLEEWADVLEGV